MHSKDIFNQFFNMMQYLTKLQEQFLFSLSARAFIIKLTRVEIVAEVFTNISFKFTEF